MIDAGSALEAMLGGYAVFVIGYFIALNGSYAGLFLFASRAVLGHLRWDPSGGYQQTFTSPFTKPISLLLPAYNEEVGIVDSVHSILGLRYPELEVVVINDGSTDGTLEKLRDAFDLRAIDRVISGTIPTERVRRVFMSRRHPELVVVDKDNGGKADALNAGIDVARYPLVASIDADSLIEEDALLRVVRPLVEDPERVVAAGGIVRVANGSRIESSRVVDVRLPRDRLPVFQIVEYLRAFLAGRGGFSAINSLVVISGAFGLFRRDVLLEVGGYARDTVGEDAELVVKIHAHMRRSGRPYRIVFVADPVCWTEAPATWRQLMRQRRRWQRGLAETLWRHRRTVANPRYGAFGTIGMPYQLLFELIGPAIELSGYVAVATAFALGVLEWQLAAAFLVLAVLFGILQSASALVLEEWSFHRYRRSRDVARLFAYSVLENFGYRQLLSVARARGILDAMRGTTGWGEMERAGLAEGAEGSGR